MLAALPIRSSAQWEKTTDLTVGIANGRARSGQTVDMPTRSQHGRHVAGRHLFICTNGRSSGKPACGPRGGDALIAAVQRELLARRAIDVMVTTCGCLGPCFDGPNAVIYPDGTWYADLAPGDAAGLVDHLIDGRALAAKVSQRPGPEPDSVHGGLHTIGCSDREDGNDRHAAGEEDNSGDDRGR
jgi:(2Fe-2S) ferredoxin